MINLTINIKKSEPIIKALSNVESPNQIAVDIKIYKSINSCLKAVWENIAYFRPENE